MILLLIVFCVFHHPPITDGVPVNPTTKSLASVPTASFKELMSKKIRESYAVLPNNANLSARINEDLSTKQQDNCSCTYFIKDNNRLVNGESQPTAIRVENKQTAVLQCIEPEMNLVWQSFGFTAKSVILTCNYCRMYTSQEIPSCHGRRLDEVHFFPTTASPVPVPKTRFKKSIWRKIKNRFSAKSGQRGKEQHDDCICSYFIKDNDRLVNGEKQANEIRVKKGHTAELHCMDPEMNLVWQEFEFTAKSINLSCNVCRMYTPQEIPSCQSSRLGTAIRCTRFSDEDLKLLIVHYDDIYIRAGSTANFSCKDYHQELSGKKESVCLRNGNWSSPPPQCKDLCPPIDENEDFAIFYSNGRNINSNATFFCKDTEHIIQGDRTKTCLPTGKWSAANPTCKEPVVHCTRFLDEDLTLLIVNYDDKYTRVGTTAYFTCKDKDQGLSGRNESVCQNNGKWSSPPPQCKGCGTLLDDDRPLIMEGENATEGAWPWMVAITFRKNGGTYYPYCSGFLINRRYVLSAAHCFINPNVTYYQARIGRVNQIEGDMYLISRIVVPPGYHRAFLYDDIALLTLAREVTTPGYNAICLPNEELNQMDLIGRDTSLAGWGGSTERGGPVSPMLQQKHGMPIMDNHECSSLLQNKIKLDRDFPRGLTSGFICTEFAEGEKRSCGGDSGGPLMLQYGKRWYAVGIISFPNCEVNSAIPDGYTRISQYLKWIAENTKD